MKCNLEVSTGAEENIGGRWMPLNIAHFLRVSVQVDNPLRQVTQQAVIRNLPQLDLNSAQRQDAPTKLSVSLFCEN